MKNINDSGKGISNFEKQMPKGWVWDDIRTFLAVARHGTLSAAASELHLGIATLSRRIERLETSLKIPLFIRHQSGYKLSDEGRALIEKAEVMEAAAASFMSDVSTHSQLVGVVRVATAENLANTLIIPALPEFQRQFPGITIELITDITTVNLHRRDAELAIRMVKPERGNITFRRIATLGFGLYGSADYLAMRKARPNSGNYDHDAFITWNERQSYLPASQWVERVLQGRAPVLTTTSLAAQISAAKAGLGLAVLPHFLAVDNGMVCVEPDVGVDQPMYLLIQSDLTQSKRVRTVVDFLTELIERNKDFLSGACD